MKVATLSSIVLSIMLLYSCGTPSPFPLTLPSNAFAEDRIVGNWKMEEDTNTKNFYEVKQRDTVDRFNYHVRFFNRGGSNPTYEANIFFSDVGNTKFINVPYWVDVDGPGDLMGWDNRGFFFVRIIDANDDYTRLTTATVNTATLKEFSNSILLKKYIEMNINNPDIYSDTVHFYKVNKTTSALRQPR